MEIDFTHHRSTSIMTSWSFVSSSCSSRGYPLVFAGDAGIETEPRGFNNVPSSEANCFGKQTTIEQDAMEEKNDHRTEWNSFHFVGTKLITVK